MVFSGLWAFFYFVTFIYMCVTWSQTEIRFNFASSNIIGAIIFAFFSVFAWAGCAILAFQRFKAGSDSAFTDHGIGGEDTAVPPDGQFYDGQENGQYSQAPFSGGEGQQGTGYQQHVQY